MDATWDYFEAGHGKGPCDGAGGLTKRLAATAVNHGARIQCAGSFERWADRCRSLPYPVYYIRPEDFAQMKETVTELGDLLKRLKGTTKVHAVKPGDLPYTVKWREVSFCICIVNHCMQIKFNRYTRLYLFHFCFRSAAFVKRTTAPVYGTSQTHAMTRQLHASKKGG